MTSRHLYFKLIREDIKRKAWAAALLGLILFFALPVATAMAISTIREERWGADAAARRYENVMDILSFGESFPFVMLVLFCGAVVMGVATFSYLHNKKQVDFYHSLPIKRNLQFAVHITTGIVLPALIYLAATGMAVAVAAASGVFSREILLTAAAGYLANLMYYILVYATVVLAVMMTGTIIASLLGSAVFFWYFPGFSAVITAFCGNWLDAYYYDAPTVWNRVLPKLSPVWAVMSAMADGITPWKVAGSLLAAVLLLGASFLLYQKRPSEAAGRTMAFRISMPIIKILLVILFGMTGALFFSSVKDSLGWMVFGAVTGVVISHCVIEVIYQADFKKVFSHEKVMAICMTITLFICFSFYFDLFRFDNYVPEADQVKEAAIDFQQDWWVAYGFDDNYGYNRIGREYLLEHGTVQNIPALLEIAQEGIRQIEMGDEKWNTYDNVSSITIRYTLKSGRQVYRQYTMSLEPVLEASDALYGEPELKRAIYPGLAIGSEEAAEHLVYAESGTRNLLTDISLEQRKQVVEAYQEEMMNMSLGRRKRECPVGELLLISRKDYEIMQKELKEGTEQFRSIYASAYFNGYYYPIYPSFTKTIAALKDCGIEVGNWLTPDRISNIQVHIYHEVLAEASEEYDAEEMAEDAAEVSNVSTITCTEPEQIEEILQSIYLYDYAGKNPLILREVGYEVEVILKKESADGDFSIEGGFYRDRVPSFILEELKEIK